MSGITNPFATNLPKPWEMDAALAQIEHNKLVGEDLRSQIAEREANRTALANIDFGDKPGGGTGTAATGGTGGTGGTAPAPRTAYGQGGPGASVTMPPEYDAFYEEASKRTGIPKALLIAQHRQESGFNPGATGSAGEIGIGQIKPSTAMAPGFGVTPIANPDQLRDPRTNILFAADYLKGRAGANVDWSNPEQAALALQRYNGGGDPNYVANVTRYLPAPGGTQTAAAPAPATPGVAARTGGTDVAGPGGGRVVPPAIGAAARQLLNMPEAEAAAAYPRVLQELRAAGVDMPNAPATYPGHDAVQRMVDGMAPQAPAATAPAAPVPQAPAAPATPQATPTTPTVPAPTPPPPTNDRNLTADNLQQLDLLRRSKGATLATVATAMSQMQAHNQALAAQYRTDQEQAANTAATRGQQTQAAAVETERLRIAQAAEARAAREERRKEDAAAVEAGQTFHGNAADAQDRNILIAGTKSGKTDTPEYQSAYANYATEKRDSTGLTFKPDMQPYAAPTGKLPGGGEAGRSLGKSDVSLLPLAPPVMNTAMMGNVAGIRNIDRALKELDAHPDSVGAKGLQPDWLIQRTDPEGVKLRAEIADILSQTFHERSGAAVMTSEAQRMKPFTPVQTDTAAALRTKLERMRDIYRGTLYDHYDVYGPEGGHRKLPRVEEALKGYDPATSAAPAAAGGWTVKKLP